MYIKPLRSILTVLALLPIFACAPFTVGPRTDPGGVVLRPGDYRLDPDHVSLHFKLDHFGFSKLVGRFDVIDASLNFNAEAPEAAQLDVIVQTASLNLNPPSLAQQIKGGGWFESGTYPEARFRSRKITVLGPDTGVVEGDLTIRGRTNPLILNVKFNSGGESLLTGDYTVGFSATGKILRSEFGIDALIPAVGDEVEIEIHAEFRRN